MAKRLTDEERALRQLREREWQSEVIFQAKARGWKWYHPPDNKPNAYGRIQQIVAGFPDLVLVKNGTIIFVELKRETGVMSVEQEGWFEELRACGLTCYLWRPSDFLDMVQILNSVP